MDIKPIKTEADCDAALAEIAQLMDAEPDNAVRACVSASGCRW